MTQKKCRHKFTMQSTVNIGLVMKLVVICENCGDYKIPAKIERLISVKGAGII